jgi:hypothetical protein
MEGLKSAILPIFKNGPPVSAAIKNPSQQLKVVFCFWFL